MKCSIPSRLFRFARPLAVFCLSMFLLASARPAFAGQVEAKHLAADTKWYLHLDFEAAKQTVVYAQVLDAVKAQFPLEELLNQLKAGIGVNPLTDITGVTVYNTSFEKEVAAVIIYAKVDQGLLQLAVSDNPDYKQVVYGKHMLHTWTDKNDGKTKVGCFYGEGMVLLADKPETLKAAVDVLDGTKTGGSALVKTPAKGAFLYGAADFASVQTEDKNLSQLISNTEAASVCAAEVDGKFFFTVNLNTKSAEIAAKLTKMIEGAKTFGEFATRAEHPTVADLINQAQITVDGSKIIGTFQHDSKTLLQTLQKIDEENKAKPKTPAAPAKGL